MSSDYQLKDVEHSGLEIAIIGMACRFPGAPDIDSYWDMLKNGKEAIRFFSDQELRDANIADEILNQSNYVKAGSLINDIDLFDASFFEFSPREAAILDPQQRLFLEIAWQSMEDAGYGNGIHSGPVGVFAGTNYSTYLVQNLLSQRNMAGGDAESFLFQISNDKDNLSTRVSYKLNLKGPSITIQTACSTSLVAVHYACQSLLNLECDMAIAGGASVRVPHKAGYFYQDEMIFSKDGHCRPFDANASGTVFGSGVGAVILKRLEDATKDNDTIISVIKGSAVNNDGSAKIGFTAPSRMGQEEVIKSALAMANLTPDAISAVEAHGTGTLLGDPLEIEALSRVWNSGTPKNGACALGSVKSNLGHLESASGIASLIKMALCLKYKTLVPSLNFSTPNANIDFNHSCFYVNTETKAWEKQDAQLRRCGVSSFGIGGTNAHVIMEEMPPIKTASNGNKPYELLLLSARTSKALKVSTQNLIAHLKKNEALNLSDVAYTLRLGRKAFKNRLAVVVNSHQEAIATLESLGPKKGWINEQKKQAPKIVFMFPGQGAQYIGMGRDLYQSEAVFKHQVDHCAQLLQKSIHTDIREILFATGDVENIKKQLDQTDMAQPALFIIEYALAKLLMSWKLLPQALIGHSIGEYTAACLAQVFSLEDALYVVAKRAELVNQCRQGDMCAVNLTKDEVTQRIIDGLSVAAINGPSLSVVSGPAEIMRQFTDKLTQDDIKHRILHTSHAFHSTMMAPAGETLKNVFKQISLNHPEIPYLSNLTGTWITEHQPQTPAYWADHLLNPVQFSPAINKLRKDDEWLFLEVGPGNTLSMLVKNHDRNLKTFSSLPSATESKSSLAHLLESIGKLWTLGVQFDWQAFQTDEKRKRISLPPYPFDKKRYWIESAPSIKLSNALQGCFGESIASDDAQDAEHTDTQANFTGPSNKLEQEIASILSSVLGVKQIDINDTFLDLGGNSLLATQVLDKLNKTFQTEIRLGQFFQNSSICELAPLVSANTQNHATSETTYQEFPVVKVDPENRYKPFPLHEMQQAQWIGRMEIFRMSNVAAHVYYEFVNEGLDLEKILQSWQLMVDRHEMLRAIILAEGGQQIFKSKTYTIKNLDLRHEHTDAIESQVLKVRNEMDHIVRPIDQWPLFEIRTTQLPDDKIRIHFSIDLLICDFASLRHLQYEWATAYMGMAHTLPKLELSFRDYVIAEANIKHTKLYAQSAEYWDKRVTQLPPAPNLPLAIHPDQIKSPRFKRLSVKLDSETWQRLKTFGSNRKISASIVILSAFSQVLGNWSKSLDFCINTTIINRMPMHPQTHDIIGEFASFAPLEVNMKSTISFFQLAEQIQAQNWKNLENRYVSGVSVLRKIAQFRGNTTGAVLPVVFTSTLVQEVNERFTQVFGSHDYFISQTPQVWLDHAVIEDKKGLTLSWHFVENLFPDGLIEDMWASYVELMHGLAEDETNWEKSYCGLTPKKQLQQREVINSVSAQIPDTLLHVPFIEQAEKHPQDVAIISKTRNVTYQELKDLSIRLGHQLKIKGVKPSQLVAIVMEKSWEQIVSVLGILYSGGAYIAIDPKTPPDRLAYLLKNTDARYILTKEHYDSELAWPETVERVIINENNLKSFEYSELPLAQKPEELAYVIYTSGSTGLPKGVMISHQAALNTICDMNHRFGVTHEDRIIAMSELTFDLSVYDIFGTLAAGGAIVLPCADKGRDPKYWQELIIEHGVTIWNSVPTFVEMLTDYTEGHPVDLCLKQVWMSGDWIPVSLPERLKQICPGVRVLSLGGATEASIWSIHYEIDQVNPDWKSIPYGKPLSNQQFHVLNPDLEHCPVWTTGELYIGGNGLALGYWKDKAKTEKAFIVHPETGRRLYRTGDMGRYLPDGYIEFMGREDLQVKIGGYRIELGEIEAVLNQHPKVQQGLVSTWGKDRNKSRLVAYVIAKENIQTAELKQFLSDKLPEYMIPIDYVYLDSFPLSANGKVDRKSMPEPKFKKQTEPQKHRNAIIDKLSAIFSKVLEVDNISIDENFFAMGGDSVLGIQIINEANKQGIEITPQLLFEKQTIAGLSEVLDWEASSIESKLSEKQKGTVDLTAIQKRYFHLYNYSLKNHNYVICAQYSEFMEPEKLETAFQYLSVHYDVFQLHYLKHAEQWKQQYHETGKLPEIDLADINCTSETEFDGTLNEIQMQLEDMQDVAESPLIKLGLLQDHRLNISHVLVIINQAVADERSIELFFKNLHIAYQQVKKDHKILLRSTRMFKEWVDYTSQLSKSKENIRELEALKASFSNNTFMQIGKKSDSADRNICRCSFVLKNNIHASIQESLQQYHTTTEEFLLIALACGLLNEKKTESLFIDLKTRPKDEFLVSNDFQRTVGNLDYQFPLYLRYNADTTFYETIRDFKEYIRKYTNCKNSNAVLNYINEDNQAAPELRFTYRKALTLNSAFELKKISFPPKRKTYLLDIEIIETDNQFQTEWYFNANQLCKDDVTLISKAFINKVDEMNQLARTLDFNVLVPSDFPAADFNQEEFDTFLNLFHKSE